MDQVVGHDGRLEVGDRDLILAAVQVVDHPPPGVAVRLLRGLEALPQVGAPAQAPLAVIQVGLADAFGVGAPDRRRLAVRGDDIVARHAGPELEGDDLSDHEFLLVAKREEGRVVSAGPWHLPSGDATRVPATGAVSPARLTKSPDFRS